MKKTIKLILIISLVIVSSLTLISYLGETASTPNPKYNTLYSKKFNEKLFNKSLIGLSENELIKLIGKPIKKEKLEFSEYYLYTNDTSSVHFIEGSSGFYSGSNKNLKFKLITFNKKGFTTNHITEDITLENDSLKGLNKDEVIRKYGKPNKIMLCDCEFEVLSYSELIRGPYFGKSPIINLRKVIIGNDNLVTKIISKTGKPNNKYDGTCKITHN